MAKRKKQRPDIDDHDEEAMAPMHKKMNRSAMRDGAVRASLKKDKKKGKK